MTLRALKTNESVEAHQEAFTQAFRAEKIEEDLLGNVLITGHGFEHLAKIDPECFTDSRRKLILGAMIRLRESGKTPGLFAVEDDLKTHGEFQRAGGDGYMARLTDGGTGVVIPEGG